MVAACPCRHVGTGVRECRLLQHSWLVACGQRSAVLSPGNACMVWHPALRGFDHPNRAKTHLKPPTHRSINVSRNILYHRAARPSPLKYQRAGQLAARNRNLRSVRRCARWRCPGARCCKHCCCTAAGLLGRLGCGWLRGWRQAGGLFGTCAD